MPALPRRDSPSFDWLDVLGSMAGSSFFALSDRACRALAAQLDAVDPVLQRTPSHRTRPARGVVLHRYDGCRDGPVALLVPAPIKAPYIWDLLPPVSVVHRLLRCGFRVYLIEWEPPTAQEAGFCLAQYADELICACCQVIARETGTPRVALAGHSLGGTLAAIFTALHSDQVSALLLFGAPVHFDPAAGALGRLARICRDNRGARLA